jgi:hypothetical protein
MPADNNGNQPGGAGDQPGEGQGRPGEKGTLAQRQDQIREAASKLVATGGFDDDVKQLVRSAAGYAAVAGQQLAADDGKAALEPSTAALNDLKKAIKLMNDRGREQAKAQLAQAQVRSTHR